MVIGFVLFIGYTVFAVLFIIWSTLHFHMHVMDCHRLFISVLNNSIPPSSV